MNNLYYYIHSFTRIWIIYLHTDDTPSLWDVLHLHTDPPPSCLRVSSSSLSSVSLCPARTPLSPPLLLRHLSVCPHVRSGRWARRAVSIVTAGQHGGGLWRGSKDRFLDILFTRADVDAFVGRASVTHRLLWSAVINANKMFERLYKVVAD